MISFWLPDSSNQREEKRPVSDRVFTERLLFCVAAHQTSLPLEAKCNYWSRSVPSGSFVYRLSISFYLLCLLLGRETRILFCFKYFRRFNRIISCDRPFRFKICKTSSESLGGPQKSQVYRFCFLRKAVSFRFLLAGQTSFRGFNFKLKRVAYQIEWIYLLNSKSKWM